MAKSEKQKQKLLVLLDILKKYSDDQHGITLSQISEKLEAEGISAERKTLYDDLRTLKDYGCEIQGVRKNGKFYYSLLERDFNLPELKLLVDAVQVSKFISEKRSNELIRKIEGLASKYQATKLQRQVYVANRLKTSYESVYYNIDDINIAINNNNKIEFEYYEWTIKGEMELRPNGIKKDISPWALTWDDENYYMVAFDGESHTIKHYRVDKMRKIQIVEELRDGRELFDKFDMAVYAKKVFNMFTGDEQNVKIQFDNSLIGVVIDRFGKDVMIIPKDEHTFVINVKVNISNMFFGWIIGLGDKVKILEPLNVVEKMRGEIKRLNSQYGLE